MEPILEVRDLTKIFSEQEQDFAALRGVSFCLYPGETLGIVGESGSGKSTLAKVICRLTEASGGQVLLEGKDLLKTKGRELREAYQKLQMVFQSPAGSFDPRRTIGFSVGEGLLNQGFSRSQAQERAALLLKQCGLSPEISRQYPHQLSGGQCQRAAIARALALSPRIVICDEATSALDVTVQKQIIELLKELKTSHSLSYLFISHNLALVQSFCDRILVMHEGKIAEEGETDQVIRFPRSEYTKYLIDSVL
ncbi:MAG TPA: dipeptide/oligopeptide/nickel ABC transporter ATP-binding protein [Candidatus Enterocloster faecavium]|uniref:Dipeptide/oligopeptide/nickel ABC transporter ATP-binding protein n=1 Tax=Candidatus Enterocloster faecavium TaxID=2838560 RepID=A0A9D2RMQ5_9FIRM|nr:dipeptide/oligopeptide/nickel ABC transporter ATP-binding protein [Candidatus Enterocloster faecavium]